MDVIGKSKIFVAGAVVLVVLSWVAVFALGLNPGIDLKGGTQWQIVFSESEVSASEVETFFVQEIGVEASVKESSDESFLVKLPTLDESTHQEYRETLVGNFGTIEERSFTSIGPVIGQELQDKSMVAIFGVILGIFLFVAWAFRKVAKPIRSWKYGVGAIAALIHDVSIPTGMFAVMGYYYGVSVDIAFIVAILVVLGFSVNDTIVVYDRIRENFLRSTGKNISAKEVINKSVNQTFMRSINTSFTLIAVLLALIFLGPGSLYYFVLTILVGTIFGTYSSIFVASPLLYLWRGNKEK